MEYVQAIKVKEHENSPSCIVKEYELKDRDINMALAKISGRYPTKGFAVNQKCKMLGFVLNGKGKLFLENNVYSLSKGDLVLISPNEKYYWIGNLTLLLPSTPAWNFEQYKLVD